MHRAERPSWFVGDLDDPWVADIAGRLPATVVRRPCAGEIPEAWAAEEPRPGVVVLHRPILTATDARRLARLRSAVDPPVRVVLCVGPHARHDDLVRWGRHFDAVLPEATAAETIRRHLGDEATPEPARRGSTRPAVRVVSGLHDARKALVEMCRRAGFAAEPWADGPEVTLSGLTIWEVPTLDPAWAGRLGRWSRSADVVALIPFADRPTVARAREAGAVACLEWPCDLDDLAHVLGRVANASMGGLGQPGHDVPPAPASLRRPGRAEVAEPGRSA